MNRLERIEEEVLRWDLTYSFLRDDKPYTQHVEFYASKEQEGLIKALRLLKKAIVHTKEHKQKQPLVIFVMLTVIGIYESKGKKLDELYRVKNKFANRRILFIIDPCKIFVKGYGPATEKELAQ